jgi:hypothetical protein
MKKDAQEHRGPVSQRQPYTRPTLRVFGPIGSLTQAGTGQAAEGMGANSMDPRRRP